MAGENQAPKCITLPNGSLRIRQSEYQRWLASREEGA
jgi:predicted DNA-binding transcriptional regulator AlpA